MLGRIVLYGRLCRSLLLLDGGLKFSLKTPYDPTLFRSKKGYQEKNNLDNLDCLDFYVHLSSIMIADQDKNEPIDHGKQRQAQPRFWKFMMKNIWQCLSVLLIPLSLRVLTAVITMQQQEVAQQQRLEDQRAAQQLRELEQSISDKRYLDDVLNNYIKDIADLLKENNGSLISVNFVSTLARAKTLNILRQLDARSVRVIRFLHEAKQLIKEGDRPSLDLSTAELRDIDLRDLAVRREILYDISLADLLFDNVTLTNLHIEQANFSLSQFGNANFSHACFKYVAFHQCNLPTSKAWNFRRSKELESISHPLHSKR